MASVLVLRLYVVRWCSLTIRDDDLAEVLRGNMFEPLRDPELFRRVKLNPGRETIVWPKGANLAPEFLRYGPDPNPDAR